MNVPNSPEPVPLPAAADPIISVPAEAMPKLQRKLSQRLQTMQATRRHLRAIRVILNMLLALALLYTITIIKALLIPLVLAGFIGLALNPIVHAGARRRIPRWLTASVLVIGLIVGIGAGIGMLSPPAVSWVHEMTGGI